MIEFKHTSVLLSESIDALDIKQNGIYADGTAGGGGHTFEILKRLNGSGKVIAIDRDPDAVLNLKQKYSIHNNLVIVNSNFYEIDKILENLQINKIDGLLLDLGVSSFQLDTAERGFSYHTDAPLDMRMSKSGTTAADLVNTLTKNELANIFFKYGEEKFGFRIADAIIQEREIPIETTKRLAEIISSVYPAAKKRDGHPARKVFQALRIAVNNELDIIETAIDKAFERLNTNGVIAIITFHSLEDRIVKQKFNALCKGCDCPKEFPVCICGKKPKAKQKFRKPVIASEEELNENNRSRSAKLRAIIKIND